MKGRGFEALLGQLMFHGSGALDRVAKDNARRVVLACILLVLLHQKLKWLEFVVVSDVDEFVIQVAEIHVGRLLDEAFEVAIRMIPQFLLAKVLFGHRSHLLTDGR